MKGAGTGIGYRLSLLVSALVLAVLALLTLAMLVSEYRAEIGVIERETRRIGSLVAPQVGEALGDGDTGRVTAHLQGLAAEDHVARVVLETPRGTTELGGRAQGEGWRHEFPVPGPDGGLQGRLVVVFSKRSVWTTAFLEFLPIGIFELLVLACMAAAIFVAFRRMVGRHLIALADHARGLSLETLDREFDFDRRRGRSDELDTLRDAIETMRTNLRDEIHGRRDAESQLTRSEAMHRQIFDSTGDAIFIHDAATGRIVDVNRAMLEMYGCTREQAVRTTAADLSAAGDEDAVARAGQLLQLAARGEPQLFEWKARRWTGEEFWVEVFLKRMEPPECGLILAAVRDISVRKETEARLGHVERLNTLGKLAGGIAHDFNNMLAGMMGAAELVALEAGETEAGRNARLIMETGRRAADLTSKLLTFARLSPVKKELHDVRDILSDVAMILERSIDKAITVRLERGDEPLVVACDRVQVENAVLNMCLNARDALPGGGRVGIAARPVTIGDDAAAIREGQVPPGTYVEVSVEDDGVGMPEEVVRCAFDPFYTTKTSGGGTGLGLAAVYGTATGHGGSAYIESEPGRGTTVRLLLPRAAAEAARQTAPGAVPVSGAGGVLVVDDEDIVRTTLEQILVSAGFEVLTAANGAEGLETYRRHRDRIEVVLLDMVMPVMGGPETFAALRQEDPALRIVLSSGFSEAGAAEDLLQHPGTVFVQKPYTRDALVAAIARVRAG